MIRHVTEFPNLPLHNFYTAPLAAEHSVILKISATQFSKKYLSCVAMSYQFLEFGRINYQYPIL